MTWDYIVPAQDAGKFCFSDFHSFRGDGSRCVGHLCVVAIRF